MNERADRVAVRDVLRPLGATGGVRLTSGPLAARMDDAARTYLDLDPDDVLHGFRARVGLPAPGEHLDGWAYPTSQATFGQWVSGLARLGVTHGVPEATERAVHLVEGWAQTLPADGNPQMGLYGLEKLLCGLVDTALYAGHEESLRLLERVVGWARTGLDRARPAATPVNFAGGGLETLEWYTLAENLHRGWLAGADDSVEDFARLWHYDAYWDRFTHPPAPGQRWDVPVWLHAYSHVNTFASAAAAYRATGEERLLQVLRTAHTWVTTTQTFATGGYGPGELTLPDDGSLGRSLEWCTDTAEIVCGSWAAFKLSGALLRATGQARYADWTERLVHSGIGAVDPVRGDGTSPYYHDYRLGTATRLPHWDRWPCCSGTYLQNVANLPDLIYGAAPDGLTVLLAAPSTVTWSQDGQPVTVEQTTSFPEGDITTLTVTAGEPAQWSLRFRVPEWSSGLSFRLDGRPLEPVLEPGPWAVLRRTWSPGDRLEVTLGAHLRMLPVDAQHPERVALAHGPVVLAQPADWTAPIALQTPSAMVDLEQAFVREEGLRYRPTGAGTGRRALGVYVPLSQVPARLPHRVYADVDAPRLL